MLGSIIETIGGLITGSMNRSSQEQANAQNLAFQREYAEKNIQQQKDFAQQGIRWKVADAVAAGLHPLAAVGAQTSSFSPISVGTPVTAYQGSNPVEGMGQSIDRAIAAGSTQSERDERMSRALQQVSNTFQLEKMSLENELLKTNIAKERAQLGPAIPMAEVASVLPHLSRKPSYTSAGDAITSDEIKQQASDAPKYATYKFLGIPLKANPWTSDANVLEERGGEGAGDFVGWTNIPIDMAYTLGQSDVWRHYSDFISRQYGPNLFQESRGGNRSRFSRGQRRMRGYYD